MIPSLKTSDKPYCHDSMRLPWNNISASYSTLDSGSRTSARSNTSLPIYLKTWLDPNSYLVTTIQEPVMLYLVFYPAGMQQVESRFSISTFENGNDIINKSHWLRPLFRVPCRARLIFEFNSCFNADYTVEALRLNAGGEVVSGKSIRFCMHTRLMCFRVSTCPRTAQPAHSTSVFGPLFPTVHLTSPCMIRNA